MVCASSAAFCSSGPSVAGAACPVRAGTSPVSASAALAQNSEPAPAGLVPDALVLGELEEDAAESSSDPPQAVSRTTAAATVRPPRHAGSVRRTGRRLVAGSRSLRARRY